MMDLEYYEISVPDRNDSIMRVNLDEVYYNLRLTWNAYGGFWMLSIYDAEMNIILGMARLVPGTIWNFYYQTKEARRASLALKRSRKQLAAMILWTERRNCYTFLQDSLERDRWISGIDSTE